MAEKKKKGALVSSGNWLRRRGKFYLGIILTILLAAAVILHGGPLIEKAREYAAWGKDSAADYVKENDPTGTVRRKDLYRKEEKKSIDFIKRYLGKFSVPEDDSEKK